MDHKELVRVAVNCNKFLYAMNWYATNETPALKDEVDKAAKNLGALFVNDEIERLKKENAELLDKYMALADKNIELVAESQKNRGDFCMAMDELMGDENEDT